MLAHYQPRESRPSTSVPGDVAHLLLNRLAAEKISHKVIRMLPPESVLSPVRAIPERNFVPAKLPPAELGNTRRRPSSGENPAYLRRRKAMSLLTRWFVKGKKFA